MRDRVAEARRARGLRGDAFGAYSSRHPGASALEALEARVLMSTVAGRMVFYNHSAFDGDDVAADVRDLGAVAPDKSALLPGETATFANYTSYSRGINGVAVDLAADGGAAAPGELGTQDFTFKVGTGADPGAWDAAPAPLQVVRLTAPAAPDTARYLITWADGAIHNRWLQVSVRANAATGLASPDVFYFGNVPGETGNVAADAAVDAQDYARVRQRSGVGAAALTDRYDFNRDARVNVLDQNVARAGQSRPALPLLAAQGPDLTAPSVSVTAPAAGASVDGQVTLSADASDNVGVTGVRFFVAGEPVGAEDTSAPYTAVWDTTAFANGSYAVAAIAQDAAGNSTTSATLVVMLKRPPKQPTVTLTAPAAGATVIGASVSLSADASDDVAVAGVQFLVDGSSVGEEDTSAPYSLAWDSTTVADGTHSIAARARDDAGNVTTSAPRSVTVLNVPTGPAALGQWGPVMNWDLVAINTVLLKDGRVLMWDGGAVVDCIGSSSASVYDPVANTFTPVPIPYATQREDDIFCSAQTLLADGRVLVVGGHDCDGPEFGIAMTSLFDPVTMTWTRGPDMEYRRWYPTATTLSDGRVLILGGSSLNTLDYVTTPEIYDPVTNTISELPRAQLAVPSYAFVYQNPDGRVIVAGSDEQKMPTYALDIATQTWTTVDPATIDAGSGVMYRPGQFMKAGSSYLSAPADNGGSVPSGATTHVLDLAHGPTTWQQTASMANARTHLNLTLLPDGNVLATGGSSDIGGLTPSRAAYPAELWSPETKTWTTMASMATPRMYHSTALLLPDGRVLVAGGGRLGPDNFLNAEIYSPTYLFKGSRPSISSSPGTLRYGSAFFVGTSDAAGIASVALLRNGSVTHSDNMNQRYVPLTFQQTSGGLAVQAPADANTAPPGDYMLFIVDTNGVPCVAPFVRFAAPYEDEVPPTAPSNRSAGGALAAASLTWAAASDNNLVARYNVYRSTTSGFLPSAANLVGSSSTTSFQDTGLAAGTYYYVVRAVDVAGNVGPASNEASAVATADMTPPSTVLTAPAPGPVSGIITLSADASDDAALVGVRFLVDSVQVGSEDTAAPYSILWSSGAVPNGVHTITAVARDASGNSTTSDPVVVNVQNLAPSGLVAAWNFDEGSGDVVGDASGHGHVGSLLNATWTSDGHYGGALSFNGVDAWVTVADAPDLRPTNALTLEAWVRPKELNDFATVLMKQRSTGLAYALYATDPDRSARPPSAYVRAIGHGDVGAGAEDILPLNTWTHLAATYDGTLLRMYVDGTLVGTVTVGGDLSDTGDVLRIGGNSTWGEYFSGLIDDVRIYNRALTADEIAFDRGTPVGAAIVPAAGSSISSAAARTVSVPGAFYNRRPMPLRRTWYEPAPQVL
jgi:hypothetical protein